VPAATLRLAKNQERRIRSGHPWVFSNEIESIEGTPAMGGEVQVHDHRGGVVGVGLYNPHSLIAVRLFARRERPIDADLFRERIRPPEPSASGSIRSRPPTASSSARAICSLA
jgi:23S rRNA (cytosine1962-C5)-methyltransferase